MPNRTAHTDGVIHEIRWSEICPWLILTKALRAALLLRVLVLATIGVLVTQAGWAVISQQFEPALPTPGLVREHLPTLNFSGDVDPLLSSTQPSSRWQTGTLVSGWYWLTSPFLTLCDRQLDLSGWLGALLIAGWALVVWAFFGGAICRIVSLYLTRGETTGPVVAMRESLSVWLGTVGSPIIALLASGALAVPLVLLGVLLRINLIAVVAGVLWCFALAWGLMIAIILIGLLFGWPLMWACLSVERSDAFDGVSRCYAYVYQRPLHLAFFVAIASVLGLVGDTVVLYFVQATIGLTEWVVSWGLGNEQTMLVLGGDVEASPAPLATQAINLWTWAVRSLATSFPVASLWAMSVGIYLLLRRQVDATEMDEITLADGTTRGGLPASDDDSGEADAEDTASSDA